MGEGVLGGVRDYPSSTGDTSDTESDGTIELGVDGEVFRWRREMMGEGVLDIQCLYGRTASSAR